MSTPRIRIGSGVASAEVAPEEGGALTGFWWEGGDRTFNWLRRTPADARADDTPSRLSCFPLVPFFGRIRGGRLSVDGKTYQLPWNVPGIRHAVHGHGWQRPWRVEERQGDSLLLSYRHAAAEWPWSYEALQRIRLGADGPLEIDLEVTNRSDTAMPSGLALHPYFARPAGSVLRTSIERIWHRDAELMPTHSEPLPDTLPLAAGVRVDDLDLDHVFEGWSGRAEILWPRQAAIEITASTRFLVIVAKPRRDAFVCEPTTHNTDAFNLATAGVADTGARCLEPGQSQSLAMRLRPHVISAER